MSILTVLKTSVSNTIFGCSLILFFLVSSFCIFFHQVSLISNKKSVSLLVTISLLSGLFSLFFHFFINFRLVFFLLFSFI